MNPRTWRIAAAVLLVAVAWLLWQNRALERRADRRDAAATSDAAARERATAPAPPTIDRAPSGDGLDGDGDGEHLDDPGTTTGFTGNWLLDFFGPRPGESVLDYRDRVLPVVQAAAAPHRRRVRENFDAFAADAALSDDQRARIDAVVEESAAAVQDRIMQGVLSGEVLPPNVKPATGVAFARDVLDLVDGANQRTRDILTDGQRDILDGSKFDIVDYLVFSTRWEDMLGVTD